MEFNIKWDDINPEGLPQSKLREISERVGWAVTHVMTYPHDWLEPVTIRVSLVHVDDAFPEGTVDLSKCIWVGMPKNVVFVTVEDYYVDSAGNVRFE